MASIDLPLVQRILEPVVIGFVLFFGQRFFERRARLVVYYGNVGFFQLPTGNVHTHTVVIRNAGKLPAHNVRIPHTGPLAAANIHVSVLPQALYDVRPLPTGGEELHFAVVAPGQTLTISYLYYPPIVWNQINQAVMSDEGPARVLRVLPTPQFPRWALALLWGLIGIGALTCVYFLFQFGNWVAALSKLTG